MQIEDKFNKIILEYCYNNFLKSFNYYELKNPSNFYISFSSFEADLSINKADKTDFYFSIDQLASKEYIKSRYEYGKIETIYFTLKGVIFYEERYLSDKKIMTKIIVNVLELIKKIDDEETTSVKVIGIDELLEIVKLEINNENKSRLFWTLSIIQDDLVLEKSIFYINHDLLSVRRHFFKFTNLNRRILKKKGEEFLNYQLNLINLFTNIKDDFEKALLLNEYNDIKLFYGLEKWKEVAIKMGSILDYLITKKFLESEENPFNNKTSFYEKLTYIVENSVFGRENNQNWLFVNNNIRKYRNYIHLTEFIKSKIIFDKSLIDKLSDVFEKLVRLF